MCNDFSEAAKRVFSEQIEAGLLARAPKRRRGLTGMVLEGAGEIRRRCETKFRCDLLDRCFGFFQQAPRFKYDSIIQQGGRRPTAGLIANAAKMSGRHTQRTGILRNIHAALKLRLDHFGKPRG